MNIQEVDELHIMVNRIKNHLQKALFYGILGSAHPRVEHLLEPDQDKGTVFSYVLDTCREPKLIHLLRKARMDAYDEGHLPPTPLAVQRLWAPFESLRFYDEGRDTQCLGYAPKPASYKKPKFTKVYKGSKYNCNIVALMIRDSLDSDALSPRKTYCGYLPRIPKTRLSLRLLK